ncbi:hypothetical protein SUGI_1204430 [Cryptomeria japonica]|uniref:uncharacterized protein LOC131061271 n=1 Tax=Cryptomeria japonica TaxID=3369 RepID=UPI002414B89D|nr:uncharacterized protein LOC131061271 [Cryptomeria japonica]XP_057850835.1 uncharacterized protein LOC131061271 [Cryptomeria japonica]XP_057850836.1 uncharacterized protein LOC131061271 [Cryptomeria japonica]XP_057850837.1 uncharacterized protein LOC131061271 [Cryptomeria japonica]XP_059069892.1 uncharacterized protein LOC131061271 [Cryptomeria japonica]GLJ56102.1 hypothetical protein SUGI_1204430 [Cryptomeria japonica]
METSRSDGGASLPPRKRLLAGLKQNGWFCSAEEKAVSKKDEGRDCKGYDCCATCGIKDEDNVKVKSGTRFVSFCSSCNALLNSGAICCYCYGRIANDKELSVTLCCCKCQHRVHCDCITKHDSSGSVCHDPKYFVCGDCTQFKVPLNVVGNGCRVDVPGLGLGLESDGQDKKGLGFEGQENGELGLGFDVRDRGELGLGFDVHGKGELGLGSGLAVSCNSNAGGCASGGESVVFSVDKNPVSSVHKSLGLKTLMENCKPAEACSTTESKIVDAEDELREGIAKYKLRKSDLLLKSPLELEELVAEAKAAVSRTAEVVAVAKDTAFRKAEEAVKAAAVAKEALNIAALVAREEREIKAAVRSKHSSKQGTNRVLNRHSKIEENEVKEDVGTFSRKMSVVDDEELARRLHRAINSSPRISRNTVSLGERGMGRLRVSDSSMAHSHRSVVPKQQTRLRIPSLKKQEQKLQSKSESVNWGKLAHKREPGSQSACGKFVGSPINKLLQTLDHSETESSVGLLALNQDPSVHKPIEADMRHLSNCAVTEVPFSDYDEKASDAGRVLKELAICNYSSTFVKDENGQPLQPEVGNLEKLAETVAVVIEEENYRCEEDRVDKCIKEEAASCSNKPIEPVGGQQSPEPGEASSQTHAGVKRKRPSLDLLKTNECRIRSSKSSRTSVQVGNCHGGVAVDNKGSPISDDNTIRSHGRRSHSRSKSERRTKSISGDFPQESQGSARGVVAWPQDKLKPSQSYAGSVNLTPLRAAPQMHLQSSAFASGLSRKHS